MFHRGAELFQRMGGRTAADDEYHLSPAPTDERNHAHETLWAIFRLHARLLIRLPEDSPPVQAFDRYYDTASALLTGTGTHAKATEVKRRLDTLLQLRDEFLTEARVIARSRLASI